MRRLFITLLPLMLLLFSGCDITTNTNEDSSKLSIDDDITYEELLSLPTNKVSTAIIDYTYNDGQKQRNFDIHLRSNGEYVQREQGGTDDGHAIYTYGKWSIGVALLSIQPDEGKPFNITGGTDYALHVGGQFEIDGHMATIRQLFREIEGTGSGILHLCYTDQIGEYKVELVGDVSTITMNFNNSEVSIKRVGLDGTFIDELDYRWYCNGSEIIFEKTGGEGTQDLAKVRDKWWSENNPVNVYFNSVSSYVGYMVKNIDYVGK